MTVEVRPKGVLCQLKCTYCYQEPMRAAGNIHTRWDEEAVMAELLRVGKDFNMFGGEALLNPMDRMERMWAFGLKNFGKNGLQTNGELINQEWIELFKKYKVGVGISIDGPGELNGLRQVRRDTSDEATLASTQKIMDNIMLLVENGIHPGIIITLHRENARADRLPRLIKFMDWLSEIGVNGGNVHVLEVNPTMPDQDIHVLSQEENIHAMLTLARHVETRPHMRWNPFIEMKDLIVGNDAKATCFWKSCDPLDTQAVYGIEGDGALSNCGRTNKEGIDWYKANRRSYARYISFYNTPDELGGCKGCRFWMACGGSCPGEAERGDFRNKTIHCRTQKALLGFYEERVEEAGFTPITKSAMREDIERAMLDLMAQGSEPITIERSRHVANHRRNHIPENARPLEVRPYKDSAPEGV